VEKGPGLSVLAASVGSGRIDALALDAAPTDEGYTITGWPDSVPAQGTLLMLADPFSFPITDFLALCNARVPAVTVVGGMASAGMRAGTNRLVVDDRVLTSGAVALMCSEDVPVRAVVSQGCRPIGKPLTVTRSEENLVYELAGQPAMARLQELVQASTEDE